MWQWFVRRWLSQQVQQHVQEQFTQAAREAADEVSTGTTGKIGPVDVGLVLALGSEAGGLQDRLEQRVQIQTERFRITSGLINQRRVAMIQSGSGITAAAAATQALIDGHHPRLIIASGFCAGLDAELKRYDLLIPREVCDQQGGCWQFEETIDPGSAPAGLHFGRLITTTQPVRDLQQKQLLHQQHGAMACDTETAGIAEVCSQRGTPLVVVRVVSPPLGEQTSRFTQHLNSNKSPLRKAGIAAGAIFKRPGNVKQLWELREQGIVASDRLAKFLVGLISQLPQVPAVPDSPS